jgi:hypothetical protein
MEYLLFLGDGEGVAIGIVLLIIIVPITWWWEYFEKPRRADKEFRDAHRLCPYCREIINRDATVCFHCRSNC